MLIHKDLIGDFEIVYKFNCSMKTCKLKKKKLLYLKKYTLLCNSYTNTSQDNYVQYVFV